MTPSPVPDRIPASQAAFLDDAGRVLQAWRRTPLLLGLTLAVAGVQLLGASTQPAVAGLAGLASLLLVGWPGAERLWYLRLWTGRSLTLGEAWRATLRCFGRFFVLALLVGAVGAVLATPVIVAVVQVLEVADDGTVELDGGLPLWATLYATLLGIAGYAVLTFVTPALVYSSKRVRDAIPIGLRLLRVSWPRTWVYALLPAVVAGVAGILVGFGPPSAKTVLVTLVSTAVLALTRGAVAAFYLRTVPGAGPDGAVALTPAPGYYPPPSGW